MGMLYKEQEPQFLLAKTYCLIKPCNFDLDDNHFYLPPVVVIGQFVPLVGLVATLLCDDAVEQLGSSVPLAFM